MVSQTKSPPEITVYAAQRLSGIPRTRLLTLAATGELETRSMGGRLFLLREQVERLAERPR